MTTRLGGNRRMVLGAVDQLVWALQNFIAMLSVSKYLSEALGEGVPALGAFSVVASILALLTGAVLQGIGEYLSVADREAMQRRDRRARAALYRRATTAGAVAGTLMVIAGFAMWPVAPAVLRDAFIWGGIAAAPLLAFEGLRVWLLLTRDVVQALLIDIARLAVHGAFTLALPLLGVPWSMAEILLLWGGSAFVVMLAVDGDAFVQSLLGKIPTLTDFSWRRQLRYTWDYLMHVGPENATVFVLWAVSGLNLAGYFRLVVSSFMPSNAAVLGIRAINTVPDADPDASDHQTPAKGRIARFTALGWLAAIGNGFLLWIIPPAWTARIAGQDWMEAHTGLPGLTLQRVAGITVVMLVLLMRWNRDDKGASSVRWIWATFVLAAAAMTGLVTMVSTAAWIYGIVAITGAVLATAYAMTRSETSS